MRVFIAGATGAIGRRLVPLLVQHDHHVTATTRSADKSGLLRSLGAEPVIMNGLDAAGVGEAVARARPDVIVHQMTALSGKPDLRHFDRWFASTNALRTKGTEHLIAAAQVSGVRRFIAQSYAGWPTSSARDGLSTESEPLDPHPLAEQQESLAAIAFLERTVATAPLEGIVLRYGSLYGPGASESLVEIVRKRQLPIIGSGSGVWSWLHVDDADAATMAALDRGSPGVYNIVDDDPAPVSEWLPALASAVGARPPMRVPAWVGRIVAGRVPVRMMTAIRGASNQKARRELGWQPAWRSWREGFRDGLDVATNR